MKKIKIGYFADGPWSHRAFEVLSKKDFIEFKFIVPRYHSNDKTLKSFAIDHDLEYMKVKNINTIDFIEKVKPFDCDLFISLSFDQIFKKEIIDVPKYKIINVHAGKLPFYRGKNILNWAIINGEKDFGVTVHFVDEGIDTGDIILQNVYSIYENDDYNSILKKAYKYCAETLEESIELFVNKSVNPIKQSSIHPTGFYCGERIQGSERINWKQSSKNIWNFVRGICLPSGLGARTFCKNEEFIIKKVKQVSSAPNYIGIPGQIIGKDEAKLMVKTLDSWVEVIDFSGPFIPKISDYFK
tara:strand:- start:143 stop:1039 length:897 start_codon:yes stop_codon:yes gene_type:complete